LGVADWAQSRTPLDQFMVSFSRLELSTPAFAKNAIGMGHPPPAATRANGNPLSVAGSWFSVVSLGRRAGGILASHPFRNERGKNGAPLAYT